MGTKARGSTQRSTKHIETSERISTLSKLVPLIDERTYAEPSRYAQESFHSWGSAPPGTLGPIPARLEAARTVTVSPGRGAMYSA